MSVSLPRVVTTLIWIHVLVLGLFIRPANAQEGVQVWLAPINTEEFPSVSSYLDVHDAEREFVFGLEESNVRIIEDGRRLPVTKLEHVHSGVQFVLAISPSAAFNIRDVQGVSRYEYLAQALVDWARARQGSTVDDLSILIADGPEATHLSDLERWISLLDSYSPADDALGPDFDMMARALDVAADAARQVSMNQAVLFVIPLPSEDISLGLQSLVARASQQGVKVFIWLVASAELFSSPQASQLATLAEQTGGQMFAYSGIEAVPSLEDYLESMRNVYTLTYESRITASGSHQVSTEVSLDGGAFSSPVQDFDLEVMPPSIAFISPPMEINRENIAEEGAPEEWSPSAQHLELLIEFPDGHARPLAQTALIVDGQVVETNTSPPFDHFTWDLDAFEESGEHILVVEVEDNLGLTGRTFENAIQITVGHASPNIWVGISRNRMILAGVIVGISGAVLLLVLVIGGRLRPGFVRELRRRKRKTDPVTQPVVIQQEDVSRSRSAWINRFQWSKGHVTTKSFAQMVPLSDITKEESNPPIAISSDQVTFGRDADHVDKLVDNESVEGLHARLHREAQGIFRLFDEESTAGTWVNYEPVPAEGKILEQGDLIHFGRVGFRFIMRDPHRVRKPVQRREDAVQ